MTQPVHPNDAMEFAPYPDATRRETYPPLQIRRGNPNATDSNGLVLGLSGPIGKRLPDTVLQMVQTVQPETAPVIPAELAKTDEVEQLLAAGWL